MTNTITQQAGSAVGSSSWSIDAETVKSVTQQEGSGGFHPGDEVYIASIAFRTTPGKAGSTSTWFDGGITDVEKLRKGQTLGIPDQMGRVSFQNVALRSFADIQVGKSPELVGTVSLVFEADLTPDATMNRLFTRAAEAARPIIAGVIEPLDLTDLPDPDELAQQLAGAAAELKEKLGPTLAGKVVIFLKSLFSPDDPIDNKINVFVGVDSVLAPLIDQIIGLVVPAKVGVAGALRTRSYTQRFAASPAKHGVYDVRFAVKR